VKFWTNRRIILTVPFWGERGGPEQTDGEKKRRASPSWGKTSLRKHVKRKKPKDGGGVDFRRDQASQRLHWVSQQRHRVQPARGEEPAVVHHLGHHHLGLQRLCFRPHLLHDLLPQLLGCWRSRRKHTSSSIDQGDASDRCKANWRAPRLGTKDESTNCSQCEVSCVKIDPHPSD